jgi:hypothetical protein
MMINPEDYIGKDFIYVSNKYGGKLRCTCVDVRSAETIMFDNDVTELLCWLRDKKKGTTDAPQPTVGPDRYIARRTEWKLVTANGNAYELEHCWIIEQTDPTTKWDKLNKELDDALDAEFDSEF